MVTISVEDAGGKGSNGQFYSPPQTCDSSEQLGGSGQRMTNDKKVQGVQIRQDELCFQ
jgi:hypothetical protein